MDKLVLCKNIKYKDSDLELIDKIISDDFDEDSFIDSLIGFEDILLGSRNSSEQYIKAIQFCSYIATGMSQTEAYIKTFPDRAMEKNTDSAKQSSASIYANRKLTKQIMQRMYLHNNLLFMDKEFKARNQLFKIGMSGESKTNVEALKVFLDNQYRERDKNGIELNFNMNNTGKNDIEQLNDAFTRLAEKQAKMLEDGVVDLKQIAESKIIDAEPILHNAENML